MHMITLVEGANADQAASALRLAFVEHGLQVTVLEEEIRDIAAANVMLDSLLTGFVALVLVVGIAALGVIAARSVVERRQEIGVMRALGFQREMVQASFMIESSFVALLGILLGTLLGSSLSLYVVDAIAEEFEGVTY